MTTPSGTCNLSDIQAEFGGEAPTSLSEYYYGVAQYVPNTVPAKFNVVTQTYATPGAYSLTVPAGVTSITATIVGGGGGAGGNWSDGDLFWPGGGGSGGRISSQTVAVTQGQTLAIQVGTGGLGGSYRFNSSYSQVPGNENNPNGLAGGASSITGSAVNAVATGGSGGTGTANFSNQGGAGGSPNGVAGESSPGGYGPQCGAPRLGGDNGSGAGQGGTGATCNRGANGSSGKVVITYTTGQNAISASQLRGKTSTLVRFPGTGGAQSVNYDFYLGGPYGTGNPLRLTYSRSGSGVLNYSLTFYNNYCGATPTFTGLVSPTLTSSNNVPVETFTAGQFSWRKGCCSGNDNTINVTVQISMTSAGGITASWVSTSAGSQQGC